MANVKETVEEIRMYLDKLIEAGEYIKDTLRNLERENPGLRERFFGAIQRSELEGWKPIRTERRRKKYES